MRRLVLVVAVAGVFVGAALVCEAGRLPKPISPISRQKTNDHHPMASLHKSRGPEPRRRILQDTPADKDRDKRRTHGVRED